MVEGRSRYKVYFLCIMHDLGVCLTLHALMASCERFAKISNGVPIAIRAGNMMRMLLCIVNVSCKGHRSVR